MEKITAKNITIKTVAYLSGEYQQMVQLRDEVLRAPLGLTFSEEFLARDANNILIAAFAEDEIIGCCQLEEIAKGIYQLRQMAVSNKWQGGGIGSQIVQFAEEVVKQSGGTQITPHARDVATNFYRKLGYKVIGDSFTEIGIPHVEMVKEIKP